MSQPMSDAQADGRACIVCGEEGGPMEPAMQPEDSPTGTMLFRCENGCEEDR